MEEQLTFPSTPKKICGTCSMFEYVGCWAGGSDPWGKCYKNRMPGNHFDHRGVYNSWMAEQYDCWEHDIQEEARMLVKEMKRKGIDMPELDRLIVMVDK
jgi:hypothetical protein